MAAVLFLSPDLMFSSRLLGAAKTLNVQVQIVAAASDVAQKIAADCRLVLIDLAIDKLDLPTVIAAVRTAAPAAQVIAYGAHVDEAALAKAADAGCDLVISRGQFHKQYAELLRSAAA
jgi:DNA-binding NarL/FixJ family response regulator